jgi:hypothetical protein
MSEYWCVREHCVGVYAVVAKRCSQFAVNTQMTQEAACLNFLPVTRKSVCFLAFVATVSYQQLSVQKHSVSRQKAVQDHDGLAHIGHYIVGVFPAR